MPEPYISIKRKTGDKYPTTEVKLHIGETLVSRPTPTTTPDKYSIPVEGVLIGKFYIGLTDPSISRRHGMFSFDGSRVTYQDLGSTNGTGYRLSEKDKIRVVKNESIQLSPDNVLCFGAEDDTEFYLTYTER